MIARSTTKAAMGHLEFEGKVTTPHAYDPNGRSWPFDASIAGGWPAVSPYRLKNDRPLVTRRSDRAMETLDPSRRGHSETRADAQCRVKRSNA
jgi:hypothetical protein